MSGYLEKIVETDPYLVSKSGSIEPTVRLLDYDALSMEKVASEALEYSKHVKKEPGKTSILVLAMGSQPCSGSSRIIKSGSCTKACAILTLCLIPLLYLPISL